MKLLSILLLFSLQSFGANYWVSVTGTNTGTPTVNSPWGSAKFTASKNVVAGDSVFFKRGDVFPFPLPISANNGTPSNKIYYGDYGTGAKPVFNNLTTLTSWTLLSGNVYYTTIDVPRLQIVTVDGVLKGMGRYPKSGYLTIESHNGLSSITSTSVSGIPGNIVGAEAVVKKFRYVIDRHGITSVSGNTINISSPSDFGPTASNSIISDGNGFFVQNYIGAVTQLGDWYYDVAAKRLYVHFGAGNSSSHIIQASLVDEAANLQSKAYITLNNLDFRGGNFSGVNALYSNNITVTNCNVTLTTEGIWTANGGAIPSVNQNFSNNYIANTFSNGIASIDVDNVTFTFNTIRDIHMFPGMGRSGDAVGNGISVTGGNGRVVSYNKVSNTGYCGIAEYAGSGGGNQTFIEYNLIDTFSVNKDDAGGLYMYGGQAERVFTNRQMRGNYVKNGIGNIEGVSPNIAGAKFACGIYMDEFSNYVNIENNLIADNSGAGIFLNSTHHDTLNNNTVYNSGFEAFLLISAGTARGTDLTVHDLYVHHNQFISRGQERTMNFEMYDNPTRINTIGVFNNNIHYRPFDNASYIRVDNRSTNGSILTDYTIQGFQAAYSKEQSSINSTAPITSVNDFRVEYNPTGSSVNVALPAKYINVGGTTYDGAISLQQYDGDVLIYNGAASPVPPTPQSDYLIIKGRRVIQQTQSPTNNNSFPYTFPFNLQ